eukprot:jgi/Undpi1/7787/HiC_scaffold_23.g10260.m1
MTSLVDILGSYVAVDDAGSDGGIVEVDGACEDGAADDDCTSSTPTRGSGPTSDGGVINVDDVSEVGGLAFGVRGVPASETAGAFVIGMTTSAGGGGAAATPGNAGDPTRNVGAESDICAVVAAGTITARWLLICPVNKHPRLTTMSLEHQHAVDKEAMEIKGQMKAPLSSPMKAAAVKLTGRW